MMDENALSNIIVDAAVEVHRTLGGPGLLESVYEEALCVELNQRGIKFERQKVLPVVYKGVTLTIPLRLDILIENLVIVECKASSEDNEIWQSQTLTYLRISQLKLGLVINFGQKLLKNNIHRVVNGL
jgi:GxxExxY protein